MPLPDDFSSSDIYSTGNSAPPAASGGPLPDEFSSSDILGKGPAAPPIKYPTQGTATWGDVGQAGLAGLHEAGAAGTGLLSTMARTPDEAKYWQQQGEGQRFEAKQDTDAMTPAGQEAREGHIWQHPLVVGAEGAPALAIQAAPAILGGAVAGPVGAVIGAGAAAGGYGAGSAVSDFTQQVMDTPEETLMQNPAYAAKIQAGEDPHAARLEFADENSHKLAAESAAIGAATALPFAEFGGGPGMAKIATSPLIDMALHGGMDAAIGGAQGGAQTAATGQAGAEAGIRGDVTPSEVIHGVGEGALAMAPVGIVGGLMHGKTRLPEPGVSGNSVRSDTDYRTPEAKTTAPVDVQTPPEAKVPQPPTAANVGVDPDVAAAATGKPLDKVTPQVTKPPVAPVEQPPVVQPEALAPRIDTEAPPAGDTTEPVAPPQKVGDASATPVPASPVEDAGVITPESPATLAAQHAAMLDPANPREAMVYPKGQQPIELTDKKAFGQVKLPDGRIAQFDKSGPSGLTVAKIRQYAKDDRLNEALQLGPVTKTEALQRVAGGEPPVAVTERAPDGTEAKAATGTTATAPDQVAALEATKTPGNTVQVEDPAAALAARQEPPAPVVQPQVVEPPTQRVTQTPFGPGRVLPDLTPEGIRARDAAAADDAQRAAALTKGDQLKAAAAAKAEAKEAGIKPRVHTAKAEQAKTAADNVAAERITQAHPREDLTHDWPNQTYTRAKAMVDEAKAAGVKIPADFKEGHPHGPAMLKLREAADLTRKVTPTNEEYGTFLQREHLIDTGKGEEAFAARRAEGAKALGSPEGVSEAKEVSTGGGSGAPEGAGEGRTKVIDHTLPTEFEGKKEVLPVKSSANDERLAALKAEMNAKLASGVKLRSMDDEGSKRVMTSDAKGNPIAVEPRESMSASDALDRHFDTKQYAPEMRPMMERLKDAVTKIAGDTTVHFISHDDMTSVAGERAHGLYDADQDHILLNDDHLRGDTPLHEVFHAATAKALAKDPELQSLMGRLQDEMGVKGDSEEFLTRLMTEKDMQDKFKAAKISPELARDIGIPKWRKATMWEGALNLMRKALGLGPRDVSAIEAAMSISEKAMWKRDPGMAMEAGARSLGLRFQKMEPQDLGKVQDEPKKAGGLLTRGVKDTTEKLGGVIKDMTTDKSATLAKAGETLASEPQLHDMHKDLFSLGKDDPMRDRLDAIQRRAVRSEELSKDGHDLAAKYKPLASDLIDKAEELEKAGKPAEATRYREAMDNLANIKRLANEFEVHPDEDLGTGKNAHLKNDGNVNTLQARLAHPEVARLYKSLPDEVKDHYQAESKYYRDRFNKLAEQKARNYIEGIEPPAGSTHEEVVQRMIDGKLTEADEKHYGTKGIKNITADDFQKRKGPYFPASRMGDFVVTGEHDIPTPAKSDRDYFGNSLDKNVRRFTNKEDLERFLTKLDLPAKVSTRFYMESDEGHRIYHVPTEGGLTRRVTSDEAGIGYGKPMPEYHVTIQNKHVEFAKTMSDAQKLHAELKEAGVQNLSDPQDRRGMGTDKSFTSPQTQALLASVDRRADLSDSQKSLMKDTIRETAVVAQNGNRFTKNLVRNNKVQGAEYNDQALLHYSSSSSRHLSAAEFQPKIDKAMHRMQDVMRDRDDDGLGTTRSRVFNEVQSRNSAKMENMYPHTSPVLQTIQNLAFIQDMASASHLLTHQVNLHYMGGSIIGARHGVMQTLRKFNSIMREAGGPWMALKHGFNAAYMHGFKDPEANGVSMFNMMRNSIKDARRLSAVDDLVATGHIHQESGLDVTPLGESRTAVSKVSRFIRDASGSMDSMGRFVTGLGAYDMEYAKQSSLPVKERHEAAMTYARQSIEKGLIHYGAGMRAPAFSSPLMRTFSQFRLPGTNMLYLLGRNAYLAFRSTDKSTRNEALKTLGAMMIGGWALSGSSALPTEPLKVLGILGSQLGITPSPGEVSDDFRRMLVSQFGASAADVIMDGPLSMLGAYAPSFAHRVASPELSFGEPDSTKPDDMMKWLGGMTFGASGSLGINILRGSQAMMGGDYEGAMKYLAPKGLADIAKATKLYQEGGPGAVPESLMQAFGVRSQSVVRQQEGKSALYNRIQSDKKAKPLTKGEQLKQAQQAKLKVMGQTVTNKNRALVKEYTDAYQ